MPGPRPLALISFDIDDTLYSAAEFVRKARRNGVKAMCRAGLQLDEELVMAELEEVVEEFSSNDTRHFDRLLVRLPAAATAGINPAILVAAAVGAYHDTVRTDFAPFPDALEALRRLKAGGWRLGVASQGLAVKQAAKLLQLQVYSYLDPRAIFLSDLVGVSKAGPKFYRRFADTLGLPPAQCLHVGDRPDHDVDSANRAGWLTALHRRSGRYFAQAGATPPAYTIQNFWDLLEILEREFHPAGQEKQHPTA